MKRRFLQLISLLAFFLLMGNSSFAHDSVIDLERMSKATTFWLYLKTGFQHIIPQGFDHILFVLSLFLLSPKLKPVLWQATAFTVAHTITLGLSMYHIIKIPSAIIEPLIAMSIIYVSIENLFNRGLKKSRLGVVFLFGLVHGLGFAGSLQGMGLPQNAYFVSLLTFNLGVELGQITVILLFYFLVAMWFTHKPYYRKAIVVPFSLMISLVAAFWTVERLIS